MEMGRLTAKLRDAVPVCLLVEGKEIKRYRNIDIPDELKKLEYQDFKFDVPTTGTITFKISFMPGVLPEAFPQTRERRTRTFKDAPVVVVGETFAAALSEKAELIEAANIEKNNEATVLIIIEEAPVVEMLEKATLPEVIDESAASPAEVQDIEEAMPEAKVELKADIEPEAKEATPAKETAAKRKKVPADTKIGKE
jgi:hypothetical protein